MIAILGSHENDISYLRQIVSNVRTEQFDRISTFTVGTIGNRNVVVAATGTSKISAAMATTLLLSRYQPYIVLHVGTASAFNAGLSVGDLLAIRRVLGLELDYTAIGRDQYGQIPGFPPIFFPEESLLNRIREGTFRPKTGALHFGSILSGDRFITKRASIQPLVDTHYARLEDLGAIDTESYAIAATCTAFKTPFFFLKTITSILDQPDTMLTRVRVGLEKSIEAGNLIIALLRDLDRT